MAFMQRGWILSVAIAAGQYTIDQAYDIPAITEQVDFINVMTYDYHGKWENKTGHNSPLYPRKDGHDADTNINSTFNHLMKLGAKLNKLVLGLPFYGRTYTLDDFKSNKVGAPAHEPGMKGQFTNENNFMGYHEICTEISSPIWTKENEPDQFVPYAYRDKDWISYEDHNSIVEKVDYALRRGLDSVMIWSIDTDDVVGKCHGVPMYLLKTVNKVLAENYNKDNVIDDGPVTKKSDQPAGSDSRSIHSDLKIWMILTVWVLHVLKQKLDVTG